jgi:hypothetical protein
MVCSGPAFIGFALLAAGLTEYLVLADVNPVAVAAMQGERFWPVRARARARASERAERARAYIVLGSYCPP